jgi:hypothetical protein
VEIVIVPAWRRPDFFEATLRRLRIADEGTQHFWLALDRQHHRDVNRLAWDFLNTMERGRVRVIPRTHPYRGNSYNVLTTYREALTFQPELVHLVEEDVFVGADYFAFHRASHELAPDAFAVSAARNQSYATDPDPISSVLYLDQAYQSIGVSFRPERLAPALTHAVPAYFANPIDYCERAFPRSRIPRGNAEQDGLLNRCAEDWGAKTVYAFRPRAYHAGFVGYHRKGEALQGSVSARADRLLTMGTAELNRSAYSYPDHRAVDLDAPLDTPWLVMAWP